MHHTCCNGCLVGLVIMPGVCGSSMGSALGGITVPSMPRVHMQARKESQGARAEVLIRAVA